ncbi:nucleotide exchange factor GrpE [Actinomadura chibensis]|uniref:Nucleotide exchange factor GrpE n=1 Tax=Actinomadura chibensis TaxID=392828 RepID=A0A5D0NML3_9ACTN|nr:nucleotide exchange factor GrpE [Actinomadura chibensis]TYB45707.1 nucleotide exchange factor GrpE [Actinomadura chibensis]
MSLGEGAPPEPDVSAARARADRRHLLAVCMDMADRLRDGRSALFERLNRGLAEIGVRVVMPDGAPFDERAHQALGREKTTDARKDMTVASTEFAGYVDADGTVLRRAQVYVYRVAGAGPAEDPSEVRRKAGE